MLKLIEGADAPRFPKEMDAMFRNRRRYFHDGSAGRSSSKTVTSGTGSTI